MRPVLFYTVGYPGAGKTTLAQSLSQVLGGEHLRGDKIGLELFRFPTYSPDERRAVYAEMQRRAAQALRAGRPVLYDAATNTYAQRQAVAASAHACHSPAIGIWVQTPTAVAKKRAGSVRDGGVVGQVVRVIPPHIFDQYVAAFEAPDPATEHEIVVVSGDAPFYMQYRRLARQLQRYRLAPRRLI
jgi:predicted kinase